MGDGLVTTRGEHWRPRRLLIQRELSYRNVRRHAGSFARTASARADAWADGATVDLQAELGALALQNLGETLFSRSFDALRGTVRESLAVMQRAVEAANFGTVEAEVLAAQDAAAARLDDVLRRLVAERLVAPTSGRDLLGVLAVAAASGAAGFDAGWVRGEAVTPVVAGHETVAFATTATAALLAAHPDVARDLAARVDAALRAGVPPAALADEVPLLRHAVEEALRLYPPVSTLHRVAVEDLSVAGRLIPRGTLLVLSPLVLQRDARWWPTRCGSTRTGSPRGAAGRCRATPTSRSAPGPGSAPATTSPCSRPRRRWACWSPG
jgi:cytochrome P450